jgi:hypothetical protein
MFYGSVTIDRIEAWARGLNGLTDDEFTVQKARILAT